MLSEYDNEQDVVFSITHMDRCQEKFYGYLHTLYAKDEPVLEGH
jgi:hypothetical protein